MSSQEYSVRLGNLDNKEYNIMRFKPPHTCDLQQLTNPKLDRQEIKEHDEGKSEEVLEGEGTEYRQKEREDARKRRRGFRSRKPNPADQPWILREHKKGGKHYIGRKEGGINSSASYYLLSLGHNNSFEAYPISNWYNFAPPVKYNFLNDEEAEERFEKRHKTLNYFSIMMSKRIKEKTEDDSDPLTSTSKQAKDSDSEAEFSSVGSDTEDKPTASGKGKKGKKGKGDTKKKRKPSTAKRDDSEAGEETDEGDMESQEMDYYSTTSSDEEEQRLLKEVKEQPRDDAEVERKEEGGIDEVFAEKSSSSDEEEDLTESGKELKALIRKQEPVKEEEDDDEEEVEEPVKEEGDLETEENKESNPKATPPKGGTKRGADSPPQEGPSSKKAKREEEKEQQSVGPDRITLNEVYKYLSRKPMTLKALMKKFIKLKPEMNKHSITTRLAFVLNSSMSMIETHSIGNKKRYSLRSKDDAL